jgi:hypothetical protein
MEPLTEAEKMYLRSRLPMPAVLLGFGVIGLVACAVVLVREWPQRAYIYMAVLILDLAATFLLGRIFMKLRSDAASDSKRVVVTTVDKKINKGENGPWIVVVDQKPYRINQETFRMYEEGHSIKVYSSLAAGLWLGFGQSEAKAGQT